ncbi:MAG TPA: MarR family transcriptional regulator [Mycobacteriales bacterium]|nr:MarR family transcriptional regulator [Mycobacteriales bacterium]
MARAREEGKAGAGSALPIQAGPPELDCDGFASALLAASGLLVNISGRSVGEVDRRTTLTQFRTMAVLARGDINLSRLASELGVNVSTAMRSIDRLIAAGYATRQENPLSRREVVLCLTPEGKAFVGLVAERRRSAIERLLDAMPHESRAGLIAGLGAFVVTGEQAGIRPAAQSALGW